MIHVSLNFTIFKWYLACVGSFKANILYLESGWNWTKHNTLGLKGLNIVTVKSLNDEISR